MARFQQILEKNEKKLIISQFLPNECKEFDENGNLIEEDYVTIKKIPYDIKTKLKFLSMKSFGGKTSKEMLKKCREKGIKISEIDKLNTENPDEIMNFMLDIDFEKMETSQMSNATIIMEQYILDYGIYKEKHSFKDQNDKPIELNYDTLNNIGNEKLIKYIIDNIKTFSKGFMLGE